MVHQRPSGKGGAGTLIKVYFNKILVVLCDEDVYDLSEVADIDEGP